MSEIFPSSEKEIGNPSIKIMENGGSVDDMENISKRWGLEYSKSAHGNMVCGVAGDCIKYIKDNQVILENGYYLNLKRLTKIFDPYSQVPQNLDFTLVSYNSGGQNNLRAIDTINATILCDELIRLCSISKAQSFVVVNYFIDNAQRLENIHQIETEKMVIVDRDKIVCENLNQTYSNGGEPKAGSGGVGGDVDATANVLGKVDKTYLVNEFIKNPSKFVKTFIGSDNFIKLSLAVGKLKGDLIANYNETHKNLKVIVDGLDMSKEVKDLIYPSDVEALINNQKEFLTKLEKRVNQRKNKALNQKDYSNPYGRTRITGLTPLKVVRDFESNPNTKFNLTQYEFAKAELDLQLINYIENGELELNTSKIKSKNELGNELSDLASNGLSGENLINSISIKSIQNYVNKFWDGNYKSIAESYHKAKADGSNPELVEAVEQSLKETTKAGSGGVVDVVENKINEASLIENDAERKKALDEIYNSGEYKKYIADAEHELKNNPTQVADGKGTWRKQFNDTKDAMRKKDILRAVADVSTDKAELNDISEAAKGLPEGLQPEINHAVEHKLQSFKETPKAGSVGGGVDGSEVLKEAIRKRNEIEQINISPSSLEGKANLREVTKQRSIIFDGAARESLANDAGLPYTYFDNLTFQEWRDLQKEVGWEDVNKENYPELVDRVKAKFADDISSYKNSQSLKETTKAGSGGVGDLENGEYVYHGTKDNFIESIAKDGLKIGTKWATDGRIFLSPNEKLASVYGKILRIKKSAIEDLQKSDRSKRAVELDVYETKKPISSNDIEIKTDDGWQTLSKAVEQSPKETTKAGSGGVGGDVVVPENLKLGGIVKAAKNKAGNNFYAVKSTTKWFGEINKFFKDNYGIDDVLYNFQNKKSKSVDANGYYTLPDGTRVKEIADSKTGEKTIYIQSEKFNPKAVEQSLKETPKAGSGVGGDVDDKGSPINEGSWYHGSPIAEQGISAITIAACRKKADEVMNSEASRMQKATICSQELYMAVKQEAKATDPVEKNVWTEIAQIWEGCVLELQKNKKEMKEGGTTDCGCSHTKPKSMAKGGLAYGNSHDNGGIPAVVKSTKQKIEYEGGEGVVNKRSMQSRKVVTMTGTPCEIASKVNQMGGGVKFKCDDVQKIIAADGSFEDGGMVFDDIIISKDNINSNDYYDFNGQRARSFDIIQKLRRDSGQVTGAPAIKNRSLSLSKEPAGALPTKEYKLDGVSMQPRDIVQYMNYKNGAQRIYSRARGVTPEKYNVSVNNMKHLFGLNELLEKTNAEKNAVGIFLKAKDTGRFLMLYRAESSDNPYTWSVVGGGIRPGESELQALAREISEETKYEGTITGIFRFFETYNEKCSYTYYIGDVEHEFEPELNNENVMHKWMDFNNLEDNIHPELLVFIKKFIVL